MKYLLFSPLLLFLTGCFQADCKEQEEFYKPVNVHFRITKKYNYNHSSWLEGIDSTGKVQKFQYYGIFFFINHANIGDFISKDSNDLRFVLTTDSLRYTYTWDCNPQESLVTIDTLKK
ncbi:hypothetical protein C3K47_06955 [Solitalea longa]|uniref:Lipoprotein n=1 Tax=Solitalea longa TaxID=2079460 RepID=A0A2S5A4N2_9SPHI|nr:hypothetical protein [Solitalea longa]POY37496.1 hypothetical protein C3K47_06955 [Solitalea longa]